MNIRDFYALGMRYVKKSVLRRCGGFIFLIPGEEEKMREIAHITKRNVFVAPVCGDPAKEFPYDEYFDAEDTNEIRILVGNSATKTNCHLEVLDYLKKYKEENIAIYCPLSYGDKEYGEQVAAYGEKLFGDKFHAIFDFMELMDYHKFLASCHVGIFACNRQQAMGNISILLRLGRKVYLRSGTSMIENYRNNGFVCNELDELEHTSFNEFISNTHRIENQKAGETYRNSAGAIRSWRNVFEGEKT